MNCDEAFDALTEPQNAAGPALERHLRECPRCRQMRELFTPALALFAAADALPPSDGQGSARPATAPLFLSPEAVAVAEAAAAALSHPRTAVAHSVPRRRAGAFWRAAAALALAVVCLAPLAVPSFPAANAPAASECVWRSSDARVSSRRQESNRGTRSRSEQIVLTCVACHLHGGGFSN